VAGNARVLGEEPKSIRSKQDPQRADDAPLPVAGGLASATALVWLTGHPLSGWMTVDPRLKLSVDGETLSPGRRV